MPGAEAGGHAELEVAGAAQGAVQTSTSGVRDVFQA